MPFLRMDGKPVGRRGLLSMSTEVQLTASTSIIWRANPDRVALIIANWGDNLGNSAGLLQIKPMPDQGASEGFAGSNGTPVGFLGTAQFDSQLPWTEAVQIACAIADTYCTITEIYDGGMS